MKPFKLNDVLLDNKVVKLRNGEKARLIGIDLSEHELPVFGKLEDGGDVQWNLYGEYSYLSEEDPLDIIGICEEETKFNLPKPVRELELNKTYYYISNYEEVDYDNCDPCEINLFPSVFDSGVTKFKLDNDTGYSVSRLCKNGQLFETEQDAQTWLDFMKNYGKEK